MTEPGIEIRIEHTFGPGFRLDIELEVQTRAVALFGPSGSGKSSVLTAVAGLWTPDVARIVVDGTVLLDTAAGVKLPPRARRVGYVPQESWLFPLMSVRQNLVFGRPSEPTLSVEEIAEALGIAHLLDRRSRMLSGGERQRVALGRAVLAEPAILVCDEPLSALDRARRDATLRLLARWRERLDIPLLFVSHQVDELAEVADAVAVLDRGRVAQTGDPKTLADGAPAPSSR